MTLICAPWLLGLGESNPLALWLSVATGIAALTLTFLTDHRTGVVRVIPYSLHFTSLHFTSLHFTSLHFTSLHLAVDIVVGGVFLATPFLLGFSGVDAWFYLANGAAVLTVVSLHQPNEELMLDCCKAIVPAVQS